jgi:nucleotide-binding universal stress UspA family protein
MEDLKRILVPFDDNLRSIKALEYAAMFASGIGAKITALHIAEPTQYKSKVDFEKELSEMVDDQLRPELNKIQKSFPDVKKIDLQIRGKDRPLEGHIVDFAKENEIDFIIMRSHGLAKDSDWELNFKSTIAYKVVLGATCPVFTFTQMPENLKIKNILMPIDLMESSLFKVPLCLSLAKRFNATINLLSASEDKNDHEGLEQQLVEVYNDIKLKGIEVQKAPVQQATFSSSILSFTAKNNIDLVVLMNRPGFRWSDLWISPIAKKIISQATVPIISIRANKPLETGI